MKNLTVLIVCLSGLVPAAFGDWTFTDINIGGDGSPAVLNSGIDWRPQGDYALIANTDSLYRYDYSTGSLSWEDHSSDILYRVQWSNDGSYAIITGSTHVYRYDHSPTGFGALTEITDIEGSGTYTTTFYDIAFNPADDGPPYIAANRQSGTDKQIVIYRYDPLASPQVYWDYSGGVSYVAGAGSSEYRPVCLEFQADGDYMIVCNSWGSYIQGFFVYDPDQSTFLKDVNGAMPFFSASMGNARTASMSPVSGERMLLIKGTGEVDGHNQTYPPGDWSEFDPDVGFDFYTSISEGDSDFSYDGSRAIFVERQQWTPNHKVMVFNGSGMLLQHLDLVSAGFTNEEGIRIYAVDWHPFYPMGLMGGGERWFFRFDTDEVPGPIFSPTPTAVPTITPTGSPTIAPTTTPTGTPSPADVPSASGAGILILAVLTGLALLRRR